MNNCCWVVPARIKISESNKKSSSSWGNQTCLSETIISVWTSGCNFMLLPSGETLTFDGQNNLPLAPFNLETTHKLRNCYETCPMLDLFHQGHPNSTNHTEILYIESMNLSPRDRWPPLHLVTPTKTQPASQVRFFLGSCVARSSSVRLISAFDDFQGVFRRAHSPVCPVRCFGRVV